MLRSEPLRRHGFSEAEVLPENISWNVMTNHAQRVHWIARAFRLAYFIQRNRNAARIIAARALNKLDVTAVAQDKRLYYQPTGRGESRKSRNKVNVGEIQLLQRLVFVESEFFEREREKRDEVTARDAIVHYIKHLVRITSRRNSFYVTLGLCRLLYGYTTAETTEVHNLVVQDPERVHDDYYYRSRKAVLLKELQARFNGMLGTTRGPRGEEKLETHADSSGFVELVAEALRWFAPWDTDSAVPESFNPRNDVLPALRFDGADPDREHRIEVNRIHAVLHPDDFSRLIKALGFPAPADRLDVPKLASANRKGDDSSRMNPPEPDNEDWEEIESWLLNESGRRRLSPSGVLRVCVDGVERARFSPEQPKTVNLTLGESDEIIEIRTRDARGELTVAMLPLDFKDSSKSQRLSLTIENGRRFVFDVAYRTDESVGETQAEVSLTYRPTAESVPERFKRWSALVFGVREQTDGLGGWLRPVAALLVIGLVIASLWFVFKPAPEPKIAKQPPNSTSLPPTPNSPIPEKPAPTPEQLAKVEPPVEPVTRRLLLEPRADGPDEGTRGDKTTPAGPTLGQVRSVFLDLKGKRDATFEQSLRAGWARTGVRLTGSCDMADAALKISISENATGRITAVVRLVNAEGDVIWPKAERASGWRYSGAPQAVAARIAADLKKERR